jgi:hypothetical protein
LICSIPENDVSKKDCSSKQEENPKRRLTLL